MTKIINQKGFAAIEAMLVVVILAIIGGTGYYVYHANKKTNNTLNSASKVAQSSPAKIDKNKKNPAATSSSGTASTPAQSDQAAIIAAVKSYNTSNGHPQTDSVTVSDIVGTNARGSFHAVDVGSAGFIAHKAGNTWQVISEGQQQPGKDIGTQYGLPSDWYSTTY